MEFNAGKERIFLARRDASPKPTPHLNFFDVLIPTAIHFTCIFNSSHKMPERPPFPGRPAQPPGFTPLEYSPDGQRLLVAGCSNFVRSFRTFERGEPDMLTGLHEDALAVVSGVWTYLSDHSKVVDSDRMTMPYSAARMALYANTMCPRETSSRC
jgi:hypothetical protein